MFNIIHTYYNEENFLRKQLEKYKKCNNYFNKIIIVDDASRKKAAPIVDEYNISIDLYRVLHDIGFNSHGCRNLAMDKTDSDWNLLIDIDWDIDIDTISKISKCIEDDSLNPNNVYTFISPSGGEAINTLLIHRDTYWKATGYDEELTNMHTGDDLFYESLRDCGTTFSNTEWNVTPLRNGRKIVFFDGDITIYDDTNMILYQPGSRPEWDTLRKAVARRNRLKGPKPVITFTWEKHNEH
tara:strand:- start:8268 stop:8987 length:720 start_codon:yes stop_codon:yes gene_type:complete